MTAPMHGLGMEYAGVFVSLCIDSILVCSSGVSGSLQISGLPFVVKNATGSRMGGAVGYNRDWGADMPNFRIYTVPNTSVLYFYYNAMNAGGAQLGTSQFSTGSDNNVIEASVTYITE